MGLCIFITCLGLCYTLYIDLQTTLKVTCIEGGNSAYIITSLILILIVL